MKSKIKFISLLMVGILSSCSVYKAGMESAENDPIPNKIPNLNYQFTYQNVIGGNAQFVDNVVRNDINQNVINPVGEPLGTLDVQCERFILKQSLLFPFLSGLTLFTGNILGMPFSTGSVDLELTFIIKNLNGDEISKYNYSKKEKNALGFYYGKDVSVNAIDVCRDILERFKKDVSRDFGLITQALQDPANDDSKNINYQLLADVVAQRIEESGAVDNVSSIAVKKKELKKSDVDVNIPITYKKAENTFVLIIANENYSYVDDVQYAIHDGEVFKEYCIKTLGVPERQVWLYCDATAGVISGAVDKMVQAMSIFENARAIIYYCGHGIPSEKTGDAYIIPTDGKGTSTETCYSLNKLYKTLAESKATNVTYFMDACFTGANRDGSMLVAARGIAREAKKEQLEGNTVVFSAASGDETAMPYDEKSHGLFTYFLLKKLQETKGQVSYGELSDYIRKNVQKEAFLTNEKPQTPVTATSSDVQHIWRSMTL